MEKTYLELLQNFMFDLQMQSKDPLIGLEITLPTEVFNALSTELTNKLGWIAGNETIEQHFKDSYELVIPNGLKIKIHKYKEKSV